MSDEDRDKLAGILFGAYEHGDSWEELKHRYPILANAWLRVADAAVAAIVVVKIGGC